MTRNRFQRIACLALVAVLAALLGGGEAGAAGRRKAVARARPAAKATARARAPRAKAKPPASAAAQLPDDPATPLGDAWKRRVDRVLAQNRPEYGAFVALDPSTGAVLTVSEHAAPGARVAHPATASLFPAASIFKIVTAAAVLESGKARSDTVVCYHGGSHALEADNVRDSPRADRSCRSMAAAFAHSTNAVFGKLAAKHLDGASLVRQAERLGFNRRLKVGAYAPEASKAALPSGMLDLARMGAGFVNSTLSPLHAAVVAAVVATGGRWPAGVVPNGSQDVPAAQAQVLQPRTVQELRRMMASTSTDGTAAKYLASFAGAGGVAVKTGTLSSRDGSGLFNTWMVGFFPVQKPEIAFAALVSTKGPGPFKAGHLTRQAIDNYLKLKRNRAGRS